MPDSPLYELYRLHLVDYALEGMRRRANALDGGKAILQRIQTLKSENAAVLGLPEQIERRLKELETINADYVAKIKTIEKQLYGGTVVNAKEIAGYEQEIAGLKKLIGQHEDESLELMEQLPAAQEAAKPIQRELQLLAKEFEAKKASDIAESHTLKAHYAEKSKERAPAAATVPKPLLAQYDLIRQKYGGIGMGVLQGNACGACGTLLPTKVIESLGLDRVNTCESCHRILFKLLPG